MAALPRWFRTTLVLAPGCLGLASGCSLVPAGQLDQCRQRSLALQSENAQLKDLSVSLRAKNDDLTARAVADARRQRLQEEAIERLEASVQAYQEEREQLASAYERLKGGLAGAPGPLSQRLNERLRDFARARPGCSFDAAAGSVALKTSELFSSGTDRLKPGARATLQALADLLTEPEGRTVRLAVAAPEPEGDPGVRRAGTADDPASALPAARAARVRDWLSTEGRLAASRVEASGSSGAPRQVEIRLRTP